MHRDRGSIKWTSLMLPEHVEMLQNLEKEENKLSKPDLDPQQIEYCHDLLQFAQTQKRPVLLHLYCNNQINYIRGIPIKTDEVTRTMKLKSEDGKTKIILLVDIIHVEWE